MILLLAVIMSAYSLPVTYIENSENSRIDEIEGAVAEFVNDLFPLEPPSPEVLPVLPTFSPVAFATQNGESSKEKSPGEVDDTLSPGPKKEYDRTYTSPKTTVQDVMRDWETFGMKEFCAPGRNSWRIRSMNTIVKEVARRIKEHKRSLEDVLNELEGERKEMKNSRYARGTTVSGLVSSIKSRDRRERFKDRKKTNSKKSDRNLDEIE
jgi:hypothetical protein